MRILLVDDSPEVVATLGTGLRARGYEVEATTDAARAQACLSERGPGHFDLILLDVKLPGRSGWEFLVELRQIGNEIPVIFLTGLGGVEERVKGLGLGADDYVAKPVDLRELTARIGAVLRRRRADDVLEVGDLRLDLARRRVERSGNRIDLTPREFDLLWALVRAKGGVVTRQALLRDVWDVRFDPGTNVVDVHVGRLRRKLERYGKPIIRNVRGSGYRLEVPESNSHQPPSAVDRA
jgi:DNA-binding response OmpR family regulator